MKKLCAIMLVLFVMLCSQGCFLGLSDREREEMATFFNDDANYDVLTGKILGFRYIESIDSMLVEISVSSEAERYSLYEETNSCEFEIRFWTTKEYDLEEGDEITFMSSSMYFYDGYVYPIVQIKENDIEYLSFEEGKAALIYWVKYIAT